MKRTLAIIFVLAVFVCIGKDAYANFSDYTIYMGHCYPDEYNAMDNDYIYANSGATFRVPEMYDAILGTDTISVDFNGLTQRVWSYGTSNTPPFNGLVLRDIEDTIYGVTVDTNIEGWSSSGTALGNSDTRLSFGAQQPVVNRSFYGNYLKFDWQGLGFHEGNYFNATIDFNPPSSAPVPEPSTMLLLGFGLSGLGLLRRRKK